MNRRNFFGTVGAVVAGAVLGRNGPPVADGVQLGNLESHVNFEQDSAGDAVLQWLQGDDLLLRDGATFRNNLNGYVDFERFGSYQFDVGEGLWQTENTIFRDDGKPLSSFDLYIDSDGVLQLHPYAEYNRKWREAYAAEMVVDSSWCDAWL